MSSASSFIVGGTIPIGSGSYIARAADAELLQACEQFSFAYVLSSRQMGKSSLLARTMDSLRLRGFVTAWIDLTSIGTHEVSADQWFLGVAAEIEVSCGLETDLFAWWARLSGVPSAQRFSRFISEILLNEIDSPVTIFIDEIDSTLGLAFADDFFAVVRACYNARVTDRRFERLSFVLAGVATPSELIRDQSRTPFNIGTRVELSDFTLADIESLVQRSSSPEIYSDRVCRSILQWTGGQPYLTQKLCSLLPEAAGKDRDVKGAVNDAIFSDAGRLDPHFQFVSEYILSARPTQLVEMFDAYGALLSGRKVICRDSSPAHNRLRLSGLVTRVDAELRIRNEIYRRIFGRGWVSVRRPTIWTPANKRLGLLLLASVLVSIVLLLLFQRTKEGEAQLQSLSKSLESEIAQKNVALRALAEKADAQEDAALAATQARDRLAQALFSASATQVAFAKAQDAFAKAQAAEVAALKVAAAARAAERAAIEAREAVLIERIREQAARKDLRGQIFAYAAAQGQIASDGVPGGNSPFTSTLIGELGDPTVSFAEAFSRTSGKVSREVRGQRPVVVSDLNGQFFLLQPSTRQCRGVSVSVDEWRPTTKLANARNDGDTWAQLFRRAGLDVIRLVNPTRSEVMSAIRGSVFANNGLEQGGAMLRKVGARAAESQPEEAVGPENTCVILFYSGFGASVGGAQYLVVSDTDTADNIESTSVSVSEVSEILRRGAAASILILDTNFTARELFQTR